jgi:hypothetical protein
MAIAKDYMTENPIMIGSGEALETAVKLLQD